QLYQVPAVTAVLADDARARDPGLGPLRPPPGATRPAADHIRPGAALFLPVAHPAHPRVGGATGFRPLRLVAAGERRAVGGHLRQGTGELRGEFAGGVHDLDRGVAGALLAVPVVRGGEVPAAGHVAELPLTLSGRPVQHADRSVVGSTFEYTASSPSSQYAALCRS